MAIEDDRAEIARLENARAQAIVAADRATLARITDDDYVHIEASGRTRDKEAFLVGVAPDGGRFDRYDLIETVIRLFGDAAIVTGVFENSFIGGTAPALVKRGRHTRVYIRRDGVWRNISHHATACAGKNIVA
ncbi:nuclear transport factor 2 family protein [Niveispirillum sp. KHB5.9]|uniref:nuclear transport factor 2 family protein n=1 Tax=Niveispirillum sp. KHB5.9 TaxID=3400269 RepID=UPI003A8C8199